MMNYYKLARNYCLVILLFGCVHAKAQKTSVVFESGKDGYRSYRIPAIIGFKKELLAFAEGRVHGAADFGDVDIVMKKSRDGGKTWSGLMVVASNDTLQAGNSAPVVDYTDPAYPEGRIFLFYNTGNKNEGDVRKGKGLREVWYKTSTDGGNTWSDAVNITTQVHRPNQPQMNAAYHFQEDWRSYANSPGHSMQFATGKYKGRIFISANHSTGEPKKTFEDYVAHGYYTDDHGKTFHLGANIPLPGSNESMSAELSDSKLMMNMRNQKGDVRARMVAISSNGGSSWDTAYFDNNLPDPVCQGSILNIGSKKGKNILAFCNAADTKRRDNLTLRISFDEGKTWQQNYPIDKSPEVSKGDYAAYSDLVKLARKKVGILYERAGYSQIVFTECNWK
ncbi:MAG: sialidase family protein [Bacteroidota bacterium]